MAHPHQPYPIGYPMPTVPPPRASSTTPLLVVALVLSVCSLVGVLGLSVMLLAVGAFGGSGAPLTGQVRTLPNGALPGGALSAELRFVIAEDGGDVADLRCPNTAAVAEGVVTVCHGTISGAAWAVAVFFEDGQGRFTALPI